jgi:serine O-acetyltransferase
VFEHVQTDIGELTRREPHALAKLGVILLNPGLHAVLLYRAARWLHLHHLSPLALLTCYLSSALTGAQISARASIGPGLVIYHPHGIAIGATAVIGRYCTLTHANLIGQRLGNGDRAVIGDHFSAATGAKVIGRVHIGDRVRVGPNAVVTQSLPDGVTVAGNPAKIIRDVGASDSRSAALSVVASASDAVVQRVVKAIANGSGVTTLSGALGAETVLLGGGVGLDSIEMLHVISAVEDEFGLTIDEGGIDTRHLRTVGSLAAFIRGQMPG